LVSIGEPVIVPLRRMLENPPSAEARERAHLILVNIKEPMVTPEQQRVLDAIEVLEQVRTEQARTLLREIERDSSIPQVWLEARQALERISAAGQEKR
jgi:hypothetical protein